MDIIGYRTMRQIMYLFLLVGTGGWCTAPVDAKTLVVLEFDGRGIPRVDLAEVSASLGRSLAATGRFRFVAVDSSGGRSEADRAPTPGLWGRALDARGAPRVMNRRRREVCTGAECALQVGAMRRVDRVVAGELVKRGSEWVLTTRMWDVATSSPLLKTEYRTERGLLDLMDRGVGVVASRYVFAEIGLESWLAKKQIGNVVNFRDTAQEAMLERHQRTWRSVVVVTGGLSLGALYGASLIRNRALENCPDPRGGACSDPNRGWLEWGFLGASAALGAVAAASTVVLFRDTRRLEALRSKTLLNVSWTPLWNPRTEAVGVATRLEF
jgi:hypothetical protein